MRKFRMSLDKMCDTYRTVFKVLVDSVPVSHQVDFWKPDQKFKAYQSVLSNLGGGTKTSMLGTMYGRW